MQQTNKNSAEEVSQMNLQLTLHNSVQFVHTLKSTQSKVFIIIIITAMAVNVNGRGDEGGSS